MQILVMLHRDNKIGGRGCQVHEHSCSVMLAMEESFQPLGPTYAVTRAWVYESQLGPGSYLGLFRTPFDIRSAKFESSKEH